jgi:hypothetical protein
MKRTDAALYNAIPVIPWGKPIRFARTENGDNRFSKCGGEVGRERIVAKHGIGTLQGGDE